MVCIYDFEELFTEKQYYLCECGNVYEVAEGGCPACGRQCPYFHIDNFIEQSMKLPYKNSEMPDIRGFFEDIVGVPLGTLTKYKRTIHFTDKGGVWFGSGFIGVSFRG